MVKIEGNALVQLIAEREGLADEDVEYVQARIEDFVNFPIDALRRSFFDDGKLWYAMYKKAGVLAEFDWWCSEFGFTFREGVKNALRACHLQRWTRDNIYAAVVGIAVSCSFAEAYVLMDQE